jgi:Holliday junction resolvase RusA-like endonuclease
MVQLFVPIPPSVNNAYTQGRGHGRRVLTAEARAYKADVITQARTAYPHWQPGEHLALTLRLYFKDKRRRDITNTIKLLEDALAEAFGFDDCRVDDIRITRAGIDAEAPRCWVVLENL